jgi:endonuclease V-like protein UPF0215 family
MVKKNIRVLGIDDAQFSFGDKTTLVAGVVVRSPGYVESVLSTTVVVDGDDATERIIELVERSRHKDQLKAVFIDGVAMGGFNVVSISDLYFACGIPVVTITRDLPDLESMKTALKSKFDDWEKRWQVISDGELIEIATAHTPVYVKIKGLSKDTVIELIKLTTVRGVIPEPVRLAHLIASGITTGESRSKA